MKYILTTLALITTLFFGTPLAHAATSCDSISSTNYKSCCSGAGAGANDTQCNAYEDLANSCSDGITTTNYDSCCVGIKPVGVDQNQCTQLYYSTVVPAASSSCATVSLANFDSCCTGRPGDPNADACNEYYYSTGSTAGQLGGTQTTTPVNSGASSSLTTAPGYNSTVNDQKALTTCSQIKFTTLLDIAIWAKCIISSIVIPGIFTLAFVVFLWGVFKFMRSSEQKDKGEAKQFIYMGLIGLFVMTSVWGIIKILGTTLGIESTVPTLQTEYLNTSKASTK